MHYRLFLSAEVSRYLPQFSRFHVIEARLEGVDRLSVVPGKKRVKRERERERESAVAQATSVQDESARRARIRSPAAGRTIWVIAFTAGSLFSGNVASNSR